MPKAHVPGFRPGHAPRKLVENRFRKDIAEKVKGELLMDCLAQVNEEQKLSAISEPDFDFEAVELPDEGPLTFEFDVEVRPEFEMPQWSGLKIEKPVREFNAADVERHAAERAGPPRAAGAVRRPGRQRATTSPPISPSSTATGACQRRGRSDPHPADAEFPRRQHRAFRQADGGRSRRRNAAGRGRTEQRRPERGAPRPEGHGDLQGARSQEAGSARVDPRAARRVGRLQRRGRSCRTRSATSLPGSWNTSSTSGPGRRSPRR